MQLADIAVVIPAYNAEATIGETLTSIRLQTLAPTSVVVVDDGSSDGTAVIAAAHPVSPIVLRQANAGPAAATNRGVAASRSELLAFVDADDLWPEERLAVQAGVLQANPGVDAVLGGMESFLDPGVPAEDVERIDFRPEVQAGFVLGALLIRRRAWASIGPLNEALRRGSWVDWWSRWLQSGRRWEMLGVTVLRRRIRPGTLSFRSKGGPDEVGRDFLEVARLAVERHRKRGPV